MDQNNIERLADEITPTVGNTEQKGKGFFTTVTPLSKFLALALFLALPFIGGWVGYNSAPEKVVEVERVLEVEKLVEAEKNNLKVVSTRITIETPFQTQEYGGQYPSEKHFSFDNSKYILEFDYPRGVDARENNVSDPTHSTSNNSITIQFQGLFSDNGEEKSFQVDVHDANYCRLALCQKESMNTYAIGNYKWEYVGSYTYADAGHSIGSEHAYRHNVGDFVIYLESEIPLHEDIGSVNGLPMILDSLTLSPK